MTTTNIFKKMSLGFVTVLAGLLVSGTAHAIPYTGNTTVASPVPAFNVFTGSMPAPAPLDGEQDFFQSRVPANGDLNDSTTQYTDPTNTDCTNGEILQFRVYVHNGASADNNDNGTGPSIAHGTKLSVSLPSGQATSFAPTATISANNAATVSDTSTVNCNGQSVTLQYVPGSASQFSNGTGVLPLSDSIVNGGVSIRSEQVPGDVWGCWNERVYVLLAVKVVIPTPTPPPVTAMCNLFTVEASADRKVTVNQFKYTAENATFKSLVINWGDNTASTTVNDSSQVIGTAHQYGADGTYQITTVIRFDEANNPDALGTSTSCAQQVQFSSTTPPTVTPPTTTITTTPSAPAAPTSLVNTGAGSVVGLFAAATAAGTVAYRWVLSRRLSRQ